MNMPKTPVSLRLSDTTLERLLSEQLKSLGWPMADDGLIVSDNNTDTADILITPPIKLGAILDRIEYACVQAASRTDEPTPLGRGFTLHPQTLEIISPEGVTISLTDTETDLLLAFCQNEIPLARQAIMTDILGYHADAETHTVETHIYRLRQKLETLPELALLIVTEKTGYKIWDAFPTAP